MTAISTADARDERTNLLVVVASTRPGRIGRTIADWFTVEAEKHREFNVDLADLAEIALPLFDEPNHPRLQDYTKPHTIEWSRRVAAADAFVFVMPEYNHGMNAALKNALDFLFNEWLYKPAGFVSYGGISGGLRAVQQAKLVLNALSVLPVVPAVTLPFAAKQISDGTFDASASDQRAAVLMLDELHRVAKALAPLRS